MQLGSADHTVVTLADAVAEEAVNQDDPVVRNQTLDLNLKDSMQKSTSIDAFTTEVLNVERVIPDHLISINQPKTFEEDDGDSLGAGQVFDEPSDPPPSKPLLAAAMKARMQMGENAHRNSGDSPRSALKPPSPVSVEQLERSVPDHLMTANQPQVPQDGDVDSLGSSEVFDSPRQPSGCCKVIGAILSVSKRASRKNQA